MNKEKVIKVADRVAEYSLYGLIFFIPISAAGIEVFAGIAFIAFFIKKSLCPDFSFIKKSGYIYLSLLLFVLFMALSLVNSGPYLSQGLYHLFTRWIGYIFIIVVAADTFTAPRRIINAIAVIIFSTSLSALSGLAQRFLAIDFFRVREMARVSGGTLAIRASFVHYNVFASYLISFIPLAIVLNLIKLKKKIYKVIIFLWPLLLISALMLTFSRGGWLGFLSGAGLLAFLSRKNKFIFRAIAVFLLALLFIPSLRERAAFTFSKGGDASRFFIWQTGFEMIKENPLIGKGPGTFKEHYPEYAGRLDPDVRHKPLSAHNIYLRIWAEAGIFALLSFLMFLGLFFYQGIKIIRRGEPQVICLLLTGIVCGIFSYLAHGFFDCALFGARVNTPFWLMAGLAQALIVNRQRLLSGWAII